MCNTKLSHQRADVPNNSPRWEGTTAPTNIQYLQFQLLYPWPNHIIHCVWTAAWWGWKEFDKSICMWLLQWILAWLTTLRQRPAIVNTESCALMQEHTKKDKSAKLIACSQTPAHTLSLCLSSFLPLLPLDFLRQSRSSCWPAHVTSAVLDQHETLLDGAHRQGAVSHQPPAWVKTGHDTNINRSAALEWRSVVDCVSLCVCAQTRPTIHSCPQHFPKPGPLHSTRVTQMQKL